MSLDCILSLVGSFLLMEDSLFLSWAEPLFSIRPFSIIYLLINRGLLLRFDASADIKFCLF